MIHKYSLNGFNIVIDVNSGAVHIVDDIVFDVLDFYKTKSKNDIIDILKEKYFSDDITEAFNEISELEKSGLLFSSDVYEDVIPNIEKEIPLLRHFAYILHTTAILNVNIVLLKKESITGNALL